MPPEQLGGLHGLLFVEQLLERDVHLLKKSHIVDVVTELALEPEVNVPAERWSGVCRFGGPKGYGGESAGAKGEIGRLVAHLVVVVVVP